MPLQNNRLHYLDAVRAFALILSIKLAAIVSITLFVSILLYDIFVRSTFIGAILNGKRQPRRLVPLGTSPQPLPRHPRISG